MTEPSRPDRFGPGAWLLAFGLALGLAAWWLIAWPVLSFANVARHAGHFGTVYFHMLGGSLLLFLGLLNLYIGSTRRGFGHHRLVGLLYLGGGALGVPAAMLITASMAHKAPGGTAFTNTSVSLLALATAWLISAAMGWRAARNRRYEVHRQWMVRSYVLVWSFVFCRLASRVPAIGGLGEGEAFIWLSWIGPLVLAEVALQWQAGGAATARAPSRTP